MNKPVS